MDHATLHSFALGIATLDSLGEIIEVYYPSPCFEPATEFIADVARVCRYTGGNQTVMLSADDLAALRTHCTEPSQSELLETLSQSRKTVVATFLAQDLAPCSIAEVYLKLHLLSHRLCTPNSLNLQGAFTLLRNIAWTDQGPVAIEDLASRQLAARASGTFIDVMSVDKFPKMTNYVVPPGVRIADSARVRLGAYLGEGTTVMHEGFINFNAGTDGAAMVEGRISAGVRVGTGSDLGGGCSTMGTLSGGGTELISVGKDCLIGANAGIGIALGDRCTVEAGLYITAGTKVAYRRSADQSVQYVKARELSGQNDLLFRRNSQSGAVECLNQTARITLNQELHSQH